jgi:segregation and condensation protein A
MSYQVKLEKFEGPLDLLLHLIRKNEVDIYDIPISIITRQYIDYLKLMKTLNLDIAGEFVLMAATLIYIKSKILLPSIAEDGEDEQDDPRAQLVQQLMEYQQFKNAAQQLREYETQRAELFFRQSPQPEESSYSLSEVTELQVSLFDLLLCFKNVMDRAGVVDCYEISAPDGVTVEQQAGFVLDRVLKYGQLNFNDLFDAQDTKLKMIVTFLALLELIRHQRIMVHQPFPLGDILIRPAPAAAASKLDG